MPPAAVSGEQTSTHVQDRMALAAPTQEAAKTSMSACLTLLYSLVQRTPGDEATTEVASIRASRDLVLGIRNARIGKVAAAVLLEFPMV